MSKNQRNTDFKDISKNDVRKLLILIAIAVGMAVIMFIYRIDMAVSLAGTVRLLSDIFFMPAILYISIAGLLAASNAGTFRIFSYGAGLIRNMLDKKSDFRKKYRDYFEYYTEKQKSRVSLSKFFIIGMACLFLSLVFNILFYFV